jgi:hypothetical protein
MPNYRSGRNHLMLDFRQGRKILAFEPYAQGARFNLPSAEKSLPLIILGYQSEAFEKLKWFFCHQKEFDGPPKIVFGGLYFNQLTANFRMEANDFPAAGLAKSFGLDFLLKKKVEEIQVVITSEALVKILHSELFAEAFLNANGRCELQMREERAFHFLPDVKNANCISTEAEIIWPQKS